MDRSAEPKATTTTRPFHFFTTDGSIAVGTIVMTVLPHVIGRAILTSLLHGTDMTRILLIHAFFDFRFIQTF